MFFELDAYRCLVFGSFRELHDTADVSWSRLAESLGGGGVPSLDEALVELDLSPVHAAMAALLAPEIEPNEIEWRRDELIELVGAEPDRPAERRAATRLPDGLDPVVRAAVLLRPIDRATFDRYRLGTALRRAGLSDDDVSRARMALELAHPADVRNPAHLAREWLADPDVRSFLGVNKWDGAEWFNKEAFADLLALAAGLDRARGARRPSPVLGRLRRAADAAGYKVDAFLADLDATPTPSRARRGRKAGPLEPKTDETDTTS
jgi:hypothetical protein